jgi:hypothetical protein
VWLGTRVAEGEGSGDQSFTRQCAPRAIEADVRKFAADILVPGHESGKDRIFLGRFGFRARNAEDARYLTDLYLRQARSAVDSGDYQLGETNGFGVRCTIVVRVRGAAIRSGWFLRSNGVLE